MIIFLTYKLHKDKDKHFDWKLIQRERERVMELIIVIIIKK